MWSTARSSGWWRSRDYSSSAAQQLLQFLLVLGCHVVEHCLVDPLLVIELGATLVLQVDM